MRTSAQPTRVPLREALRTLGISRSTFQRSWVDAFTPYLTDGGHRRIASDELAVALQHANPVTARCAVVNYRAANGRV